MTVPRLRFTKPGSESDSDDAESIVQLLRPSEAHEEIYVSTGEKYYIGERGQSKDQTAPSGRRRTVAQLFYKPGYIPYTATDASAFEKVAVVSLDAILTDPPPTRLAIVRHRSTGGLYLWGTLDKTGTPHRVPLVPFWAHEYPEVQRRFPRPTGYYTSRIVAQMYIFNGRVYAGAAPPCLSEDCALKRGLRVSWVRRLCELRCVCPGRPRAVGLLWVQPDAETGVEAALHVYSPQEEERTPAKLEVAPKLLGTSEARFSGRVDRWHLGLATRTNGGKWRSPVAILRSCFGPLRKPQTRPESRAVY